jgi:uncharacterized membrane protein YidH (DUF202 family)
MSSEREILAKIRTLLALERNYLSEERTALAEFRTGLTLALVSPPALSLLTYIFQSFPIEGHSLFVVLIYIFLIFLTLIGTWISVRSRSKLKKISNKIQILKDRQLEVIKDSEVICSLIEDCIIHN